MTTPENARPYYDAKAEVIIARAERYRNASSAAGTQLPGLITALADMLSEAKADNAALTAKVGELADAASGGWADGYLKGTRDTLSERVPDPAKTPIDLSGWGATFHRHAMSNEIHRDGGPECTYESKPSTVYPFDPDSLAAHEALLKADAWDEGHEVGSEKAWAESAYRKPVTEKNPYRSEEGKK